MDDSNVSLAVANIATQGETDIFPRSIESQVFGDCSEAVRTLLSERDSRFKDAIDNYPPSVEQALAPVGYAGFRWGSQIEPVWNAYLLSLALEVAPAIEAERSKHLEGKVFSYRYSPDPSTGRLFREDGWHRFRQASIARSESWSHVIVTDIADFYPRIYHHRLENNLKRLGDTSDLPWRITKILQALSDGYSFGLPVGGPAARILSEIAITPCDRHLTTEGLEFVRFADDYHVFVNSREAAYGAIARISEILKPEGLSLQKSKTHVLTSGELKRKLSFDDLLDQAERPAEFIEFLRISLFYDPYSPSASDDYKRLQDDVRQFNIMGLLAAEIRKSAIHISATRRLLRAIKFLEEDVRLQAILTITENLERFAPIIPTVMLAISGSLHDTNDIAFRKRVVEALQQRVLRGDPIFSVPLNVAFLLRAMVHYKNAEGEALLVNIFKTMPSFVRKDIILLLAEWDITYWLSAQRERFSQMPPSERRAFLVASYKLGDEGNNWRGRQSFQGFDAVVRDWMATRASSGKRHIPIWSLS